MNAVPLAAAAATPPGTNVVVIVESTSSSPSHWIGWIGWSIGAALLIGVAVMAARRSAMRDVGRPRRLFRVSVAAFTWSSVIALMLAPQQFYESHDLPFVLVLILRMAGLAGFAFVLFGGADLFLEHFRPQPSRNWLMIAPPLFIGLTLGFVIASGLGNSFDVFPEAGYPVLIPAGGAAGLSWWSWLPAPHGQLAHVFE
jgi:hypothetical protein